MERNALGKKRWADGKWPLKVSRGVGKRVTVSPGTSGEGGEFKKSAHQKRILSIQTESKGKIKRNIAKAKKGGIRLGSFKRFPTSLRSPD